MGLDRLGHHFGLANQRPVVDAGAAADPVRRLAAEERVAKGGGRGRVADTHLAQGQHVQPLLHRHHAVGYRPGAVRLVHGRGVAEVTAERVHRRAAVDDSLHHLLGDRGRIGRDAAGRHPVVTGEDRRVGPIDPGPGAALPGGEPTGQVLQAAESARRFGQSSLAPVGGGGGFQVRAR